MRKEFVTVLMIAAFVAGCAGMSDSRRTKTEGTAAGAGIGAVVGAAAGQIFGRDTESTVIGAALGAAIGGGAGWVYGNHVANKKAQYASQEDYLNACIASARQVNNETRQYNASLRTEISRLNQEIDLLVAKNRQNRSYRNQLARKREEVQQKQTDANNRLQRAQDEVAIQKEVLSREKGGGSSNEVRALDQEIARLEQTARELESQTQALAAIDQKARI